MAVRLAGPSSKSNPRLKLALEKARAHSLPKATINRAMEKGAGAKEGEHIEEVIYEGFAPHGMAFLVLCLTDNRARTVSEIRYLFKKHKGHLGEKNSVMWMFNKVSLVQAFCPDGQTRAEESAIDIGAEDLAPAEGGLGDNMTVLGADAVKVGEEFFSPSFLFYGKVENLHNMKEKLIQKGWTILKIEWVYKAKNKIKLDTEQNKQALALWQALSEHPDCQSVHTNIF